jgi:hypothetical protein
MKKTLLFQTYLFKLTDELEKVDFERSKERVSK